MINFEAIDQKGITISTSFTSSSILEIITSGSRTTPIPFSLALLVAQIAALKTRFPDVKVQRCTVHKLRNIANHCPRAIQANVMADVKRVIYATSKRQALEEFQTWKRRYQNLGPKAVACLEKDLAETLQFLDFPYRMWVSLRTTNIIERVVREFRRRTKVMDTFPTEESCIRIMFSLIQTINEDWKTKPMKNFR